MKRKISFALALVMILSIVFGANTYASNEKAVATSQINVYKNTKCTTRGTSSPSKSYKAYISKNDDVLTVKKVTSSYVKVTYPTKSGVKTGYIKRSDYNNKTKAWSYDARSDDFMKDKRFKDGVSWNARSPKLSPAVGTGCYAYAADFAYYVFGKTSPTSGKKFTKPEDIRAGDIIKVTGSQHWFVVLERNGNKLTTAEGNWKGGKVVESSSAYTIKNNTLYRDGKKFRTFSAGYHFQ